MAHRPAYRTITLLAASLLGAAGPLAAQQAPSPPRPGPYARMVVIAPKPGQQAAFEAGYQRHLEWHRANRDPWTWYGWSFVLGERLGLFMDGTFGHAEGNFDRAVNPAGDAADNAANVNPHADFLSHGVYERLDAVSHGAALPDSTQFLVLTTYHLAPGEASAFGARLAARAAALAKSEPNARFSWYRLRLGGTTPQYVLMRAAPTWAAATLLPDFFEGAPAGGSRVAAVSDGVVVKVTNELLRYRPTLSYHP